MTNARFSGGLWALLLGILLSGPLARVDAQPVACSPTNYTGITNTAPLPANFCAYAYLPFRSRIPENPQQIDTTNTSRLQNDYAPNSDPNNTSRGGQITTLGRKPTGPNTGNTYYPVYKASSTDPLISINCASANYECSDADQNHITSMPNVRIPPYARPSAQYDVSDQNMEVIQPDGHTIAFAQCRPQRDWQTGDTIGGSGSICSSWNGGSYGSIVTSAGVNRGNINGGPNFAALPVHYNEVVQGQINHALTVFAGCFTGERYPALYQALGCNSGTGLPSGVRIWLKLTRAQIDATSTSIIPAHMRVFAYAAHEYGMFSQDTGDGEKWFGQPMLEDALPYLLATTNQDSFWTSWFTSHGGGLSGDLNLKMSGAGNVINWQALASNLFVLDECYSRGTCSDSIPETVPPPTGGDRWVSISGGNDSANDCQAATNQNTPKQHIANGIACLQPGERLIVRAGVYAECLNDIIPSGTAATPTIILSETPRTAILRPTCKNPTSNSVIVIGSSTARSYITLDGLVIDGVNLAAGQAVGVEVRSPSGTDSTTTSNIALLNLEVKNMPGVNSATNSHGIAVRAGTTQITVRGTFVHDIGVSQPSGDSNLSPCLTWAARDSTVETSEFARCSGAGISGIHPQGAGFSTAGFIAIRQSYLHDNGAQGVLQCEPDAKLYDNILARNGTRSASGSPGDGIALGGPACAGLTATNSFVYNNTVIGNATACVALSTTTGVTVSNNLCWQNTGSDGIVVTNSTGVTGATNWCAVGGALCANTGDPVLTNTAFAVPADFQPQGGSPVRNAGTNITTLGGFTTDYGGAARIQEGAQDIGAWEVGAGIPVPPLQDPIAWWKMEEGTGTTVSDSSVNNYVLTLTTSPGPTFQPGLIGSYALGCGGDNGSATTAGAFNTTTYTWMMRLQATAAPNTTSQSQPIRNGDSPDPWGFNWSYDFAGVDQAAYHAIDANTFVMARSPTALQGGITYHLAATFDGGSLILYVNGVAQTTTLVSAVAAPGGGQFRLCGKPNEKTFAGRIDEVKIWNRALTAAEIAAEYAPATRRARHRGMAAR